jgi:uncharacterized membrane protein YgaE (UPF0421/DUF939 family)
MAADRGDQPRPGDGFDQAEEFTALARRRGIEAGRARLRQLEIIAVIAAQCGLAAAVSWEIAYYALGEPAPVFAPSAAVGTIVAALGQRARRTAELLIGVALGLIVSDLLLLVVGFGSWQTGVVVTLAIGLALLMIGRSGALVAQAGSTAVLISTLSPSVHELEWPRIVEAGVGGIVGLIVVALLLPINPMRVLDRAAAPVVDTVSAQLENIARALAERGPDLAIGALEQLRGVEPDFAQLHEALNGAEEVVTIAPARWKRRHEVERYRRGIDYIERVVLECRELALWAATCVQNDEAVPQELPAAVRRLAEAIQFVRQDGRRGEPQTRAEQAALDVARLGGVAAVTHLQRYADGMVTQLWTAAGDVLRAIGHEPDRANRLIRDAAQGAVSGGGGGSTTG